MVPLVKQTMERSSGAGGCGDAVSFLQQLIGDKESANVNNKAECTSQRQLFKYTVGVLTMGFLWCSLPSAFDKEKHVHLIISLKKRK